MAQPLFTLNTISYTYPGTIPALMGIDLTINKGDRVAFIGANGAGKSTLLTLLDALIFPTSGTMQVFDCAITERSMNDGEFQRYFRRNVGFVFQNPDIQLFCPTVEEDILFGPLQLHMDKSDIKRRFQEVVDTMHVTSLLHRSPHQLSIGEKKKVAIASVLIMDPQVLLLDEPTAGLDPQTTRDIIKVLFEAHVAGKTIVMATHDLHIVEEIVDTVHVLGGEKTIIRSGNAEDILSDSGFLKRNNLVHIHVHRHAHSPHAHEHGHTH